MPPLFNCVTDNPLIQRWSTLRRWRFVLTMLLSACLCMVFTPPLQPLAHASVVAQQSVSSQQLMQRGRNHYAAGEYATAVTVWQQAAQSYANQGEGASAASALSNQALAHLQLGQYEDAQTAIAAAKAWLQTLPANNYTRRVLAQVLNTEGQLFMAQGNAVSALTALQQATEQYAALEDVQGQIRAQLNQVQILHVQGRLVELSRSLKDIEAAIESLADESELELKTVGLRQLGIALQQSGDIDSATAKLTESLTVAEQTGNATHISAALLSLGNLAEGEMALTYYERAADEAPTLLMRSQAQVNAFSLMIQQALPSDQPQTADQPQLAVLKQQATDLLMQLETLPPSRSTFFVRINLANQLLQPEWFAANISLVAAEDIATFLTNTVEQARSLGDGQGQTYGLGYLGRLYELNGQTQAAIQITQEALVISQSLNAGEADYQWQWQLGRLLETQGETDAAIAAYKQALQSLQRLRSDLVAANRETKFSFRDGIEPVYRDLVSLLLKTDPQDTPQDNLLDARDVIESLQVEELVNFFRADCVVTRPQQIDQVDSKAAVIYPIILEDRIEVIVGLPDQSLRRQPVTVPQTEVNAILDDLLREVANPAANVPTLGSGGPPPEQTIIRVYTSDNADAYQVPAQQVYEWLIRPFEADLEASGIDTLAFVLDGKLRNIPMSVLYDGSQHLIEKYAIALTPGLQLLDPQPLAARQVQALAGGLSESRKGFSPLPFVADELTAIEAQVPSRVLLNEDFDAERFEDELASTAFPVVHLATHGEFGATLEDTFILTWDGKINANQLSTFLQSSEISRDGTIELLVLSACETASGDDRAALGLAGIAVRSGARSTLATLWQVNDKGTSLLMSDVYRLLAETKQTKAQVLRQAQLNLMTDEENPQYHHPYFWAPFVLVGNWL